MAGFRGEMNEKIFKDRTKQLAIEILRLVEKMPRSISADVLARQIVRSGTSIGANYRATCRAKATADLPTSSRSSKKKAMKLLTGWN
jgi:four helix bundle protein